MAKTTVKATTHLVEKTLFDKIESWGEKNDKKIGFAFLGFSILFSMLLFNARISEANDDALYLEGGWRYVNEFPNYFYTQNAPLYVMLLGLLTKLVGFKLLVFKLVNVVFNFLAVYFFHKAFRKRIPYAILIPVLLFISCNHLIQYFASMTFTEAFYLFLQSLFFYFFFKLYDALEINPDGFKHKKEFLLVGLFAFFLATTKSAGIVIVPSLFLFFVLMKQYKNAFIAVASYGIFKVSFEILVRMIWGTQNQFAAQSKTLTQKDPYDASLGNEDLTGFIVRVIENSNLYFSKRFFQILGFQNESSTEVYGLLALFVIALFSIGCYVVFKKNKPLLMFAIFSGAQLLLSFIILATRWDQPRIVMICMPIMLIIMFYGIYYNFQTSSYKQFMFISLIVIICSSIVLSSFKRGAKNIPIVKKNMAGDIYYGYTPDWQNFLKCSAWCADSLPQSALVISRKAPMSFVYSKGKKFFPIYSVIKRDSLTNQSNPDSALAFFNEKKVTHILLASLRINPTQNTGQVINTIHNIIQPIMTKYPNKLKIIHTEGVVEQSYVLEIVK